MDHDEYEALEAIRDVWPDFELEENDGQIVATFELDGQPRRLSLQKSAANRRALIANCLHEARA